MISYETVWCWKEVKLRKSFVKKFDEGGLKNYNSYGEVRIYRLRENVKYRYTTTTDECTRKKGYISLILTKMSDTRDDIITAREPTALYTFFYFIFGNSVHKKTLSGDAHNYCASRFDYDDNDGFVLGDREITWPVIHMQYLSKVKKRQPTAASPYKAMNQGWKGNKNRLKKTGFYCRFLLVFFKKILKKTGFYWFFSKFCFFRVCLLLSNIFFSFYTSIFHYILSFPIPFTL